MDRKARNGQSLIEFLIVAASLTGGLLFGVRILQSTYCVVRKHEFGQDYNNAWERKACNEKNLNKSFEIHRRFR